MTYNIWQSWNVKEYDVYHTLQTCMLKTYNTYMIEYPVDRKYEYIEDKGKLSIRKNNDNKIVAIKL